MKIAVIGAGASGMTAALQAASQGADVTLFEGNLAIGKKLLVTGSGRCNITNAAVSAEKYACADTSWMTALLGQFGLLETLSMLEEIGIPVKPTEDGWYYPLSESAHSVVQAFASALDLAGVKVRLAHKIIKIKPVGNGFLVGFTSEDGEGNQHFERVVVSTGGLAYPSLGTRGELFPVLEKLGLPVLPARPALAPILAELGNLRPLKGMRFDVGVRLMKGSEILTATRGNLIFTEWGLNGPAVMDVSHIVTDHPAADLTLSLDFLNYFEKEFTAQMSRIRTSSIPLQVFLGGFFPPKAAALFIKNARLPENIPLVELDDPGLNGLIKNLKDARLRIKGVRGFEYCQVSVGGVPVSAVNPLTMETKILKGLYLTGETLDVVGPCGGYNLQFAFSSGALAGRAATVNKS